MEYIVPENYNGKSVFDIIRKELKMSRRMLIRLKTLDDGIMLNGEHVTVRALVKPGDVLNLASEDSESDTNFEIEPVDLPITIVYEDDDLLIVSKPPNMVTHPSHNHQGDSLGNALAYYYREKGIPFVFRPANRLDRDTSGLVITAKNRNTAFDVSRQLMDGRVRKCYTAILCGTMDPPDGEITGYVKRVGENVTKRYLDTSGIESDFSLTHYTTLKSCGDYSLVCAEPVTGRTHQLRVHFSHMGHPILGDDFYGTPSGMIGRPIIGRPIIGRQALHASSLSMVHPRTGEPLEFTSPLPDDMAQAARSLFGDTEIPFFPFSYGLN